MRPASRARNQVREPRRRKTRAGGRGRARRIRAQKRVPPQRATGRRAKGAERNATEGRYAGTEPQSFGGGMGNMTNHDTMQGSFMNRPAPSGDRRGPGRQIWDVRCNATARRCMNRVGRLSRGNAMANCTRKGRIRRKPPAGPMTIHGAPGELAEGRGWKSPGTKD